MKQSKIIKICQKATVGLAFLTKKQMRGFTFVEMMVAVTLITVVFVSILGLVNYTLSRLNYLHDYLVASYLAQEGIELIIEKRNTNWLNRRQFNYGLNEGRYRVDYRGVFAPIGVTVIKGREIIRPNLKLRFDDSLGFQYGQGNETIFFREVAISYPSQNVMKVRSKVEGKSRDKNISIIVEDNLFDWFSVSSK